MPTYNKINTKKSTDGVRIWRKNNPLRAKEHGRRADLKKRYGLTTQEYEELLKKFNYACGACSSTKNLCVDYDHTLKRVRGILCRNCNVALGFLKDNWVSAINLANYVYTH